MMHGDENQHNIINAIGKEIAHLRRVVDAERHHPGCDPDAMDDKIKQGKQDVMRLMRIREDLETIFFGALG